LRGNNQVGTDGAKFAIDLIPNVRGDSNHCGRDRYTQRNGSARQQLAPFFAVERIRKPAGRTSLTVVRTCDTGRNVRLLDNHRVGRLRGF